MSPSTGCPHEEGSIGPQDHVRTVADMRYEVMLADGSAETIDAVDGYAPDGTLTTFFTVQPGRAVRLDPWAIRVLSLRTDRIVRIASLAA